jgi:hypothetical protein
MYVRRNDSFGIDINIDIDIKMYYFSSKHLNKFLIMVADKQFNIHGR